MTAASASRTVRVMMLRHPGRLAVVLVCLLAGAGAAGTIEWKPLGVPTRSAGPKAPLQLPGGDVLSVRHVHVAEQMRLVLTRCESGGPWGDVAVIASDAAGVDLGDCHLLRLRDGRLWCAYRRNRFGGEDAAKPSYAIEIAESRDDGQTWQKHSTVAAVHHAQRPQRSRGLWSSFVLQKRDGSLQCYFDDEDTPARSGFEGHQWLVMKTWNERAKRWENPVIVSRAHDAAHLSRDGMPSVVELPSGRLMAAFESVQVRRPHANLVRLVTSDDGGRTWSWRKGERRVLYEPADPRYLALAPWMIRRMDDALLAVFCTDEDRDTPGVSGTPPHGLRLDIKCIWSLDEGATWSPPTLIYAGEHRNYLPGFAELTGGALQVHFDDYAAGGVRIVRGSLPGARR